MFILFLESFILIFFGTRLKNKNVIGKFVRDISSPTTQGKLILKFKF